MFSYFYDHDTSYSTTNVQMAHITVFKMITVIALRLLSWNGVMPGLIEVQYNHGFAVMSTNSRSTLGSRFRCLGFKA